MSITLSPSSINYSIKNAIDIPLKRELVDTGEFGNEELIENKMEDQNESNHSTSDANSDVSDLENNGTSPEHGSESTALDYSENSLALHPVADFIKKEFLPDFSSNLFRSQNIPFKADSFGNHARSPFLLPTEIYKNFLASLGKRKRNSLTDCYSLYPRNMLFSSNFGLDVSDDENNGDSPNEEVINITNNRY